MGVWIANSVQKHISTILDGWMRLFDIIKEWIESSRYLSIWFDAFHVNVLKRCTRTPCDKTIEWMKNACNQSIQLFGACYKSKLGQSFWSICEKWRYIHKCTLTDFLWLIGNVFLAYLFDVFTLFMASKLCTLSHLILRTFDFYQWNEMNFFMLIIFDLRIFTEWKRMVGRTVMKVIQK